MQSTVLAAPALTGAIGPVPSTAVAVSMLVVMVFGIIGKGKKKLNSGPAQIVGLFGEIVFLRSDGPTLAIGEAVQSITAGIAANPDLGNIGMVGVCLVILALMFFMRIVPASGLFLGMLLGGAMMAAPGSIWKAIIGIISIPLSLLAA
ncbi:hypothetical protein ACFRR6_41860 [Streptomyces sp. NPDC056891]|uniref:hypothetical protein n=1 Tax=Streptomyces sp. NPDC056891 TaxID=3345961 RepID=UPI00367904D9